jgi:hypothetical protein
MTTATKREKLSQYIKIADDKKVEELYTIAGDGIAAVKHLSKAEKVALIKQAASDPLFLADLKEIRNDFENIDREI